MSLQAKQGLPFGNQVVGWFVMGKFPQGILYTWYLIRIV